MWTNDAAGFPLPLGCYYGTEYQDISLYYNQTKLYHINLCYSI